LVTNPSGIGINPKKIQKKFKEHNVTIQSLIGLEHGFLGLEEDFSDASVTVDTTFQLPIYHIYKLKNSELEDVLAECDVVILDVQDMGMRCYTYLTVLKRIMDKINPNKTDLIVLDHVSPGIEMGVRGDLLVKGYENFAGEFPLPFFTGLTMGEAANYYNKEFLSSRVNVKVVPVSGFTRKMRFEDTGLSWNTPSPNLPTLESARNYYALVLLEGFNVSVGRGTPAPFIYFGAPWMDDTEELAKSIEKDSGGDYYFQTVFFKPAFNKYKGVICKGLRLTIVNLNFDPLKLGYNITKRIKEKYPDKFEWAGKKKFMIDNLWGSDKFRKAIDANLSYEEFQKSFESIQADYQSKVKRYYLYPP
jgi:uncharacterized protein YbbC (DUF1343 family)